MSVAKNIVNVSQASLCTVSVEVKTIRISKKQMTISVFRQIEVESPFTDPSDGRHAKDYPTERGVIWGRVSYIPKESPAWTDYYVIWQKGNELRKFPMCKVSNIDNGFGLDPPGRQFLRYLVPENNAGDKLWMIVNGLADSVDEPTPVTKKEATWVLSFTYESLLYKLTQIEEMDQLFISV